MPFKTFSFGTNPVWLGLGTDSCLLWSKSRVWLGTQTRPLPIFGLSRFVKYPGLCICSCHIDKDEFFDRWNIQSIGASHQGTQGQSLHLDTMKGCGQNFWRLGNEACYSTGLCSVAIRPYSPKTLDNVCGHLQKMVCVHYLFSKLDFRNHRNNISCMYFVMKRCSI